jgi:prefoldin subunit 5
MRHFANQSERTDQQQQELEAKARQATTLQAQLETVRATNGKLQQQTDELTLRLKESVKVGR